MAHFQEGSPERKAVINEGANRLSQLVQLQLQSIRELMAARLEGKVREDFLQAFPDMAKRIISASVPLSNLRNRKEVRK